MYPSDNTPLTSRLALAHSWLNVAASSPNVPSNQSGLNHFFIPAAATTSAACHLPAHSQNGLCHSSAGFLLTSQFQAPGLHDDISRLVAREQEIKGVLALGLSVAAKQEKELLLREYILAAGRGTGASIHPCLAEASASAASTRVLTSMPRNISKVTTVASERSTLVLPTTCDSPEEASKLLNILGTTLRSKSDRFYDVTALPYPRLQANVQGTSCQFFPDKLFRLLQDMDEEGTDDIVSFLPHGRAFVVHKPERFVKEIMPKYFHGQSKWNSFSRQLNLYGFHRVASGPSAWAYYHELFLRGCPSLCRYMRRVGAPTGIDRRRFKLVDGEDPDFESMPPVQGEHSATHL